MTAVLASAADGSEIRGFDEGSGPPIIVLHPGMDDGTSWNRVAARLAPCFRVLRPHRRTYRLDLDADARDSMEKEIADVAAVAEAVGPPVVLVGHSSGGVIAIEALLAAPSAFAGAVVYEAPVPIGPPLGGEALERAKAALDAGRVGRAMRIFMRDIVKYPPWLSFVFGLLAGTLPFLRSRVPRQLVDCEAIDRNGVRLESYAGIVHPVLLLLGERSPAHLGERTAALQDAMPGARTVGLPGQEHTANRLAPALVARLVAEFADTARQTDRT